MTGTHTYAEEGSYTVIVTITDVDFAANTATARSPATRRRRGAGLDVRATPAVSSTSFPGAVAMFTDADPRGTVSDYTATVGLRPFKSRLSREAVLADTPLVRDRSSDLLGQLEGEARALSLRRRTLHERIDYLRGDAGSADQIAYLEAQAREVSVQRLELHARIDALRAGQSTFPPTPAG